jgi:hypothetical protein
MSFLKPSMTDSVSLTPLTAVSKCSVDACGVVATFVAEEHRRVHHLRLGNFKFALRKEIQRRTWALQQLA